MNRHIVFKSIGNMILGLAVFAIVIGAFKVTTFASEEEATDLTKKTTLAISSGEDSSFLKIYHLVIPANAGIS